MALLTLALHPLATQLKVPTTEILGAAQAGPVTLAVVLWFLVRRGGMLSRRAVIGLWSLAAAGLVAIAVGPAGIGPAFISVATRCMAMVGAEVAAGYHVQANKLTGLSNPTMPGGHGAPGTHVE